jgi:serine/threonine protein kinase/WD40 repeat protein
MTDEELDPIESLVADALERVASGGWAALDAFCSEHPDAASEIRNRIQQLQELGALSDGILPLPPRNGDFLGPYRLVREIGRGGQGVVYEAEDPALSRRVAIKLLSETNNMDAARRMRLEREAQIVAQLNLPEVCAIYSAELDGPRPYVVMPLIEGRTLESQIRGWREARASGNPNEIGSAPHLRQTLEYFRRVAMALHQVHEKGVVHRDLKAGNLMVRPDGSPMILDFGLARDQRTDAVHLTATGSDLGTPAYMSPEQVQRRVQAIDRRTDVYSLGITLFEALTLERPFDAPTIEETKRNILEATIPDARKLIPTIPRDVQTVLERAMERDLERRYGTALDLAQELGRILAGEPVLAQPASPWLRARRWIHRNRVGVSVAASAGAFVVIVAGLWVKSSNAQIRFAEQSRISDLRLADSLVERARRSRLDGSTQASLDLLKRADGLLERNAFPTTFVDVEKLGCYLQSPPPWMAFGGGSSHGRHALSWDSSLCAESSDDGVVRCWDVEKGVERCKVSFAPSVVTALAIAPYDGRVFCGITVDSGLKAQSRVVCFDPKYPDRISEVRSPFEWITCMAFSPDGGHLAVGCKMLSFFQRDSAGHTYCGSLRTFDFKTLSPQKTYTYDSATIECCTFQRDGGGIIAGGGRFPGTGGRLIVQSLDGSRPVIREGRFEQVCAVALSPDGNHLAFGGGGETVHIESGDNDANYGKDHAVHIVDLAASRPTAERPLESHKRTVKSIAFTPDGDFAISGSEDGDTIVWNTSDWSPRTRRDGTHRPVLSRDGTAILSRGDDGQIVLSPVRFRGPSATFETFSGSIRRSAPTNDSLAIVVALNDKIHLLDAATGIQLGTFVGSTRDVESVSVSCDNRWLELTREGFVAEVWDMESAFTSDAAQHSQHSPLHVVRGERASSSTKYLFTSERFSTSAWSRDGRLVAFASSVEVELDDVASGEVRFGCRPTDHDASISAIAISGDRLALGLQNGSIELWDSRARSHLRTLRGHKKRVMALAFSEDGASLLSGSADTTIVRWDVESGRAKHSLRGHTDRVVDVAFLQSEAVAVSRSSDGVVKFWNVANEEDVLSIGWSDFAVRTLGLSQDGQLVFLGHVAGAGVIDLRFPSTVDHMWQRVTATRDALTKNPNAPDGLAALGEWYGVLHRWELSAKMFQAASAAGAKLPALSAFRSALATNQDAFAREQLERATKAGEVPDWYASAARAALLKRERR